MRIFGLAMALFLAVTQAQGWTGSDPAPVSAAEPCRGAGTVARLDIPYRSLAGVERRLLSLDLYRPLVDEGCPAAPVMVLVHGGGWIIGDKRNRVGDKVSFFNGLGWVFVSVNYRLSPTPVPRDPSELDPERIAYPVHEEDVAAAIAWVYRHVAEYGGDPRRISLMGHSAGAAITATIATDGSFLQAHGLGLGVLRHAVSLDTAVYDLPWWLERVAPSALMLYLNAFGTDPTVWDRASAISHVAPGRCIPPFFVVTRGTSQRVIAASRFADALRMAGVPVTLLETPQYDHAGVNEAIGNPADTVITPCLESFLTTPSPPRDACIEHHPRSRRPSGRATARN